jgi:hypothetical protein
MHKSRNLTAHTYNEDIARKIIQGIRDEYFALLGALKIRLEREHS